MVELVSDVSALVGRHMKHLVRIPEKLLSVTLMPVAYVVVFGVLFGSAISVPGSDYRSYLMAGIFTQMMLTNVGNTALGVAGDLSNGVVDRFRSLPMSRSSVLIARTLSDLTLAVIACVTMAIVGYLMGWRVHEGFLNALAGFGLLLLLGYTMAWLGALIGLLARSAEAVNSIAFMLVMPLTFLSNAFIPLDGLPGWLRWLCEWNPVSAVVAACRELFGNTTTGTGKGAFPVQYPVPVSLVLCGLLLAAVVPAAVGAYRRAAAR
ncbi:ABC transporter permease [Streptomyces scopuliridis]|uniref:ABC transporter permease n=1 Tax=Streptomyces scopuliridis TaxID=452529 RepID=A0ACD4ZUE6_9ACTN|nr:ABC transporter permease [Streptomyces scopuliridis]WSB37600.1 ABC transporter permease [Streptomyces scopuliridis]WSC02075.1 ABC transporter permease [Streptomyces scopuliridis]WSC04388.1 ABC transporter permease [Streptomyces scopuliridis]